MKQRQMLIHLVRARKTRHARAVCNKTFGSPSHWKLNKISEYINNELLTKLDMIVELTNTARTYVISLTAARRAVRDKEIGEPGRNNFPGGLRRQAG